MKQLLLYVVVIGLSMPVQAQVSTMTEEGNAIGLAAGLQMGKEFDGFTCHLAWSIDSRFDIEANFVHTNYNTNDQYTYDGVSNGLEGTLTWWMLKKPFNRSLTLDLGLKAGFDNYAYRLYNYWTQDEDGNNDSFYELNGYRGGKIGLETALSYWLTESLFVLPSFNVMGEMGNTLLTNAGGFRVRKTYIGMKSRLGVAIVKKLPDNCTAFLKPNVLFNTYEEPVCYNITLGYIIGF
jgi:hypothetical protein